MLHHLFPALQVEHHEVEYSRSGKPWRVAQKPCFKSRKLSACQTDTGHTSDFQVASAIRAGEKTWSQVEGHLKFFPPEAALFVKGLVIIRAIEDDFIASAFTRKVYQGLDDALSERVAADRGVDYDVLYVGADGGGAD